MESNKDIHASNQRIDPPSEQQSDNPQPRYLSQDSWFITRLLCFQYFMILPRYLFGVTNENQVTSSPHFEPMYDSEYLWARLRRKRGTFSIMKELFLAERSALITMIVGSLIVATAALFGAFYQRFLFRRLEDIQNHEEHPFETSGWVFFSIIMATGLIRFLIFNYIQGLANQSARNIRIHLQNTYFRVLLRTKQDAVSQGFLINNFFVSINIIAEVLKLLPYFLLSFVIVIGISAFIVGIVGSIGVIVFGFTVVFLLIELGILKYMLHLHHHYVEHSDRRTTLTRINGNFMLRLTYNKLVIPFMNKVEKWRNQETSIDFRYNLSDGMIQILTEFIAVFTIFMYFFGLINLYVIQERHDGLDITFREIFEVAILFTIFRTPVKMVGYGFASILEGYAALHRLQQMFGKCNFRTQDIHFPKLTFNRLYNDPTCFQGQLQVSPDIEVAQIRLKGKLNLPVKQGILTMVVGKLDSKPSCGNFIKQLEHQIRLYEKTVTKIDYKPFLIDGTIRDNIVFYSKLNQARFKEVLEVTHLNVFLDKFPERDQTKIQHNHFETLFEGLSLKIQLARALYMDVDYLLIDRLIFKEYEFIIEKIRQYRGERNKTTVIVNLSGSYYHLAEEILILDENGNHQKGSYEQMKEKSDTLKEFEAEYINNVDLIANTNTQMKILIKIKQQKPTIIKQTPTIFFKFYGLVHPCAGPLLIILLVIPPLLELYFEAIITQTFQAEQLFLQEYGPGAQFILDEYSIVFRSGITVLVFFIMNVVKVIVFSIFIKLAAFQLFKQMMRKFIDTNIEKALSHSMNNRTLDFERNIQHLDTKISSDLDVGLTLLFEQITAVVFGIVSSVLFLVIGIPFMILILLILYLMGRYNRKLYNHRLPQITALSAFYFKLIYHRQDYAGYNQEEPLFRHYRRLTKEQVNYQSNQEWVLEAFGIMLEIIFLVMLGITIIVTLVRFQDISTAFIELAISFLIGLGNTSRIQLRIMETINISMIGISNIFLLLDEETEDTNDFPDDQIQDIQFKAFGTHFQDDIVQNLNLKIQRGERIVVLGSKRSGKRIVFLNLLKILHKKDIEGDIHLNGFGIYDQKISRIALASKIYFLQKTPMVLDKSETVRQAFASFRIEEQDEEEALNKIWKAVDIPPQFTLDTQLKDLSYSHMDIFGLARAYLLKTEILVIDGGMGHIDTISRQKLTSWIIEQEVFKIVIDLTNRIQVIRLYPRLLMFVDGKVVRDQEKAEGSIPEELSVRMNRGYGQGKDYINQGMRMM